MRCVMRHAWTPEFQLSGPIVHSLYCALVPHHEIVPPWGGGGCEEEGGGTCPIESIIIKNL